MADALNFIDPEHTALLVMDFQVHIVDAISAADVLLSRTADAIAVVRRHGGQIGYVRVAFEDSDFAAIPSTNKMFERVAAMGNAVHSQSPATAVHEHVAPQEGDIVVRKTRVGAFSTTDLDGELRHRGITSLILSGISTSGVVLSTVRDAADRDYQLVVLSDACADRDRDAHDFLTEKIFPRQADVVTTTQLEELLSPRDPGPS
jgi:nicotinamidase-related amidase